jgi:hypothetical protein
MKEINPFVTVGYASADYFCDRENEVSILSKNVQNGINTTLISPRRLGKTGLIYRFFDALKAEADDFITVYVDIRAGNAVNGTVVPVEIRHRNACKCETSR